MKESEKIKYIKWYRLAQKAVNDEEIIPNISDDEIISLVSKEDWLIFLLPSEGKKEDAYSRDDPSIFMDMIEDKIRLGIFFNTIGSVEKIKNILTGIHDADRKKLAEIFNKLDDEYETVLSRKVKSYNFAQVPEYHEVMKTKTNQLNENFIRDMFEQVIQIREEGVEKTKTEKLKGKYYFEGPVIDLAIITIDKDENKFIKRILELKKIFTICTKIKTDTELRQLKRTRKGRLEKLNKDIEQKNREKKDLEKIIEIGILANTVEAKKKLKNVIKELQKLEKEKKILEEENYEIYGKE